MKKVVCFGEVMMRLSPPGYLRFGQGNSLDLDFGGAEANVAVSLANYGDKAQYLTKLPENPLADACIQQLRGFGVDVSAIARGGERMGIYFMEKGASMRPSKVVYDRAHSAISQVEEGDFDWEEILKDAGWFHTTGITPALSDASAAVTIQAVETAKKLGVPVSCDLNYRKKLWSREKAKEVMGKIVPCVDVLIANEEDAYDVFGLKAEGSDIEGGKLSAEGYRDLARKLAAQFGCKKVAFTLRESRSANDNGWSALLYDSATDTYVLSDHYDIHIVDRVGGGDSFGGGLIHSLMKGDSDQDAIRFAAAASALKQTIEGDLNLVSEAEVKSLLKNGGSGRVQR